VSGKLVIRNAKESDAESVAEVLVESIRDL